MDEDLAALYWAMRHLPPPPEPVVKARTARDDLWARVKAESWRPLTRDERRLDRHYTAVLDAYDAGVVTAYRDR